MTTRIVVVGAGVAGYTAVETLRKSPIYQEIKIIWIAPEQKFVYKPFLFDVISGYRKLSDCTFSLTNYCERFRIDFIQAEIATTVTEENALILANGNRVNYEYLILATGEDKLIPQHLLSPFSLPSSTVSDVQQIITHIDEQFALAQKQLSLLRKPFLSLVVTGQSIQSIEMLFALYNHTEVLRKKYDFRRNEINLSYITAEKQLGGDIPLKLSDMLEQYAKDHAIDMYIHQSIESIGEAQVQLNTKTIIDTHTVVVEGTAQLNRAYKESHIKEDEFGGVKVNNYLQLEDFYNVYACGSIVNFYDWHKKEKAWHSFNTAQAQAKVAAQNVVAEIRGKNKEAYNPAAAIELLPVSDQLAIGVYGDMVYFNSIMHYTRMFFATKYLWQLTMPEA